MSLDDMQDNGPRECLEHLHGEKRFDATLNHTMLWESWPFLWDVSEMKPLFDWMLTCFHRQAQTITLSAWWEEDRDNNNAKESNESKVSKASQTKDEKSVMEALEPGVLLTLSAWWEEDRDDNDAKESNESKVSKVSKASQTKDEKSVIEALEPGVLLTQFPTHAVEPPSLPQCEQCVTCGANACVQQVANLFSARFHFCSPMCWHEWLKGL